MRHFLPTAQQLREAPELCKLVDTIAHRINTNRDVVILIDGEEGAGKSTLAFRLGRLLDDKFHVGQVGWGLPEAVTIGIQTPKGGVVVVDEAVEGLQAREAMTTANKLGQKWLQVNRAKNLILIVCYPSIWDLDIYSREHRVWLRIYVEKQGVAQPYERFKVPWDREARWRKFGSKIHYDALDGDPEFETYKELKDAYIRSIEQQMEDYLEKESKKKGK